MSKRALIAMSGGVDSSVAAVCMQQAGYDCIGITMKLYDNSNIGLDKTKTCCSLDDTEDARRVCERIGIDFYVNNFKDDFNDYVIEDFLDNYRKGRTPNPCIRCNRFLKFERLYNRAKELGCDTIVTGHYARVLYNEEEGVYELHKGIDSKKDQSYVLYMLTQEQLAHTHFPIGEMDKDRTRELAEKNGFVNAHKPDSQDICFIPDGDYHRFLSEHGVICNPGNFVDEDGNVLGRHTGICNYTYGQRKGLGISSQAPLYVKEIRPLTDEVVLSDNESLHSSSLMAEDVSWTLGGARDVQRRCIKENNTAQIITLEDSFRCKARIRYHHREADATVSIIAEDKIKVTFDEAQRAITPGQAVVLYLDDIVLGGGTII